MPNMRSIAVVGKSHRKGCSEVSSRGAEKALRCPISSAATVTGPSPAAGKGEDPCHERVSKLGRLHGVLYGPTRPASRSLSGVHLSDRCPREARSEVCWTLFRASEIVNGHAR